MKDSIWSALDHDWLEAPSVGLLGGLLISWEVSMFTKLDSKVSNNLIWLRNSLQCNKVIFNIINVYAPQELNSKKKLWGDIREIMEHFKQEPFLLIVDFNCIYSKEELENYVFRELDSREFNDFIILNKLWDIPLQGHKFTWFGHDNKKSKLDRALINWSWPSGNSWSLGIEERIQTTFL